MSVAFVSGGAQDTFFFNAYKNWYGHGHTGRSGSYGPEAKSCLYFLETHIGST